MTSSKHQPSPSLTELRVKNQETAAFPVVSRGAQAAVQLGGHELRHVAAHGLLEGFGAAEPQGHALLRSADPDRAARSAPGRVGCLGRAQRR